MKLKEFLNYIEATEYIRVRVYNEAGVIESVTSSYMLKNYVKSDSYKALGVFPVMKGSLYNIPCTSGDQILNISVKKVKS